MKGAPHQPAPASDPPAIELLRNEPALEVALLTRIARLDVRSLTPIRWDDVGSVWLAIWQRHCTEERAALSDITTDGLPIISQDPTAYARRVRPPKPGMKRIEVLSTVIGAALAVVLARRGWVVDASPGESVAVSADGVVIKPFQVMRDLLDGRMSGEAWRRTCEEAGIGGIDLGDAADPEGTVDEGDGSTAPHASMNKPAAP
jgi:hypothetical protein